MVFILLRNNIIFDKKIFIVCVCGGVCYYFAFFVVLIYDPFLTFFFLFFFSFFVFYHLPLHFQGRFDQIVKLVLVLLVEPLFLLLLFYFQINPQKNYL